MIPQTEKVIRLPQEHEYITHQGRIPLIYVRTFPREYWDFSVPFRAGEVNALLMTGEALVATLEEGLGTALNITKRAASGDFLAMLQFDHFVFSYSLLDDGRIEYRASLDFVIVDKAGRQVDAINLSAKTVHALSEGPNRQLRTASDAMSELLSLMERDLAAHARQAWNDGLYSVF